MSASTPSVFDLDAGRLCLDFANTLSPTSGEHLASYADLLAFARQANLLTPDQADRLQRLAEEQPNAAARALQAALRLRTAVRAVFFAVADARAASEADLQVLNDFVARALAHARLVPRQTGDQTPSYGWEWAGEDLDRPVWPITRSAVELLTNAAEVGLVRQCGGPTCEWLFLDASKNRSRQWCSMQSCGNRAKARRHYERVKATRAAAAERP
jgi:predicted RNA-binding Zn ribbon-like protein